MPVHVSGNSCSFRYSQNVARRFVPDNITHHRGGTLLILHTHTSRATSQHLLQLFPCKTSKSRIIELTEHPDAVHHICKACNDSWLIHTQSEVRGRVILLWPSISWLQAHMWRGGYCLIQQRTLYLVFANTENTKPCCPTDNSVRKYANSSITS